MLLEELQELLLPLLLAPARPNVGPATNITTTGATIPFTPGTGGGTVAKWQWSLDNRNWNDITGGASARRQHVFSRLANARGYTAYIRGVTADGTAGASGSTSFTTRTPTTTISTTVPERPYLDEGIALSANTARIRWRPRNSGPRPTYYLVAAGQLR